MTFGRRGNRYQHICAMHWHLAEIGQELEKIAEDITDGRTRQKITNRAQKIQSIAKKAEVQGQKMEDRLYLYREAIESLGFERKKRRKRRH